MTGHKVDQRKISSLCHLVQNPFCNSVSQLLLSAKDSQGFYCAAADSAQGSAAGGDTSRLLTLFSGAVDKLELMTFDGAPKGQQPAVVLITASLPLLQEIAASQPAQSQCASALCKVRAAPLLHHCIL